MAASQYMVGVWPDLSADIGHQFNFDLDWKFASNKVVMETEWPLSLPEAPAGPGIDGFLWPFKSCRSSHQYAPHHRMVAPSLLLCVYVTYLVYTYKGNAGIQSRTRRIVNLTLKLLMKLLLYIYLLYIHLYQSEQFNYEALVVFVLNLPSSLHAFWVIFCQTSKARGIHNLRSYRILAYESQHVTNNDSAVQSCCPKEMCTPGKVCVASSNSEKSVDKDVSKKPLSTKSLDAVTNPEKNKVAPVELNSRPEAENGHIKSNQVPTEQKDTIKDEDIAEKERVAHVDAGEAILEPDAKESQQKIINSDSVVTMMLTFGILMAPRYTKIAAHAVAAGLVVYPIASFVKNKLVFLTTRLTQKSEN